MPIFLQRNNGQLTAGTSRPEKRMKATQHVVEHIQRVQQTITEFVNDISADGVLLRPHFQAAAFKVAREDLGKAIAIIEQTKWGTFD